MKKKIIALGLFLLSLNAFANTKGSVTVGSDIIKNDSSENDKILFGGAYSCFNITSENEYITAGGKFYYRLNSTDSIDNLGQKFELKKALLKVRPFGDESIEFAMGKLYSYYLPGNFFQLSEIYTGASRWGKTGVGFSFNKLGFFGGIGIPLSESYVKFSDSFGLNIAFGYDFKKLNSNVPLKFGADIIFTNTKQNDESYIQDFSSTISVLYNPADFNIFKKNSFGVSFSYNAEPFVASSVFKNVSNYNNKYLKKANFGSINTSVNIGKVQFTVEGEFGRSINGSLIPLYVGNQILIPVTENLVFKPRLFYYAALDLQNKTESRQTYEIYPRVLITYKNWVISAGYDFDFKQVSEQGWNFEWYIPFYVEYKIKK